MHRHGLLGAYIPEFAPLHCLVQFDLYHRYTVDEHTLRSIEVLESLSNTSEGSLRSLALLYHQTSDKALLKFALLLHDLGKDIGPRQASHVHRSGELTEYVCERFGLSVEQRHVLQLLVVNHLVMNRLAQRRDITDPKVIAEFAAIVESVPYLEQLYLLTYADTSAVGPEVWTVWKGTLLADLYRRTLDYLVHKRNTLPSEEELRQRLRPAIREASRVHSDVLNMDRFLDAMPAKYLVATPPEEIARHIRLTQPTLTAPLVLDTTHNLSVGFTNVTVCVEGRRGVFAMIAGALSRNRLNILGAQIYTSKDGLAVDTLQVETTENTPVTDERVWTHVEADLRAALAGECRFDEVLSQRRYSVHERKFQTFARPPQVIIDNAISDSHTVIEVQTQDRLGLLYKLTHLLFEQGFDIALAKISTEANRAIDVFYVTDAAGEKIVDDAVIDHITQALMEALQ
jgi:[protein-PII] uridylyltransferase